MSPPSRDAEAPSRMRRTFDRWTPLPAIALLLALQGQPAAAQDVDQLNDRLQSLQGDYADLRLQLAQSGGLTPAQVSSFETRLSTFEQELRKLTGMVEQVTYQQNQLSQRLDRMQADMEYRLSALEGGQPPAGGPAPAPAPAPAPSPAPSQSGSSGASPQDDVQPLGTVPQDQLSLMQQQNAPTPITPAPSTGGGQAQSAGVSLPSGTPKEQYDYAFGLLRKADYAGAETALTEFIKTNPNDPLAANARYWLGETYYVRGQYQQAASAFGISYQEHPNGPKAVDSLLKLGLSLSQAGNKGDACAVFQELETRFPNAPANVLQRSRQERGRLSC